MFDIQYFANINYYIALSNCENVIFAAALPYQKGWFNNKCVIASSTGELKLSVPIVGGRNQSQQLIDVRIAYDQNWRHQHLRAIETCYGNSPFFDFYFLKFENFFQRRYEFLVDLNLNAHELIMEILKRDKKYILLHQSPKENNVLFSKLEMKSKAFDKEVQMKYEQVFENKIGFIKNLSIIDLIFCTGTQANKLLNNCLIT